MGMRRGVGIGGLQQAQAQRQQFQKVGDEKAAEQLQQMQKQMGVFRQNLEDFAKKHKNDIKKNPEFRLQFQRMCASVGVDPLASQKGFWAELLGFGDFYYELGVQIVELCLATRSRNGGLLELSQAHSILERKRGARAQPISTDDIERSIQKLKLLSAAFGVVTAGAKRLIQSVPLELNTDNTMVLAIAEKKGSVTLSQLKKEMSWTEDRSLKAMETLLNEGMAWVDDQSSAGEREYWFIAFLKDDGEE